MSAAGLEPGSRTLPAQVEAFGAVPEEWNDTGAEYPADTCIHQLVEVQAARTPHAEAVVDGGERLIYRELNERANRLAHHLVRLGVGPEARVGICMERGAGLVVALLAVLKSGGAYVPLDPAYPVERLQLMLADAGAAVLLTAEKLRGLLAVPEGVQVVALDGAAAEIAAEPAANPERPVYPRNLAYLIYTSGSTGRAKAVAIEHRSAVAMLAWAWSVYSPDELGGMLASTSICFDMSVFELFAPLARGGRVIVVENALALPHAPAAAEVRLLDTVPSAAAALLESGGIPAGVRTVNLGGELLKPELVDALYAHGVERVYDLYGPSEDTTFSTFALRRPGAPPTIGRPIANTRCHVVDEALRPVAAGAAGELYIGGAGITRGYLGRPGLTASRYLPDPFSPGPGARMYRTGDRVRWLPDGTLEYLGRLDHQVKIRGFRVEPGEVESVLRGHPAVRDAVVVAYEHRPGDRRLAAYVVPRAAADANGGAGELVRELKRAARERLPEYMVPSVFASMERFPLSPNGKVDRRALPAPPERPDDVETPFVAPRTEAEARVAEIWAEVLGVRGVGVDDDVFALGAHSLAVTQVSARLRARLGVELPLRDLFAAPTVAALAATVLRRRAEAPGDALPAAVDAITPAPRDGRLPLSLGQERIWFLVQLSPGNRSYNFQAAITFRGALQVPALRAALSEIVRRHEIFRTTFPEADGEPCQRVHPPFEVELPLADLSSLPPAEREEEERRRVAGELARLFDLGRLPLVRWLLVRRAPDEHLLLHVEHHIVHDGWSFNVFLRELLVLYGAFVEGRPSALPELPVQFADYAAFQRRWLAGGEARAQLEYWRERLAGSPAVLELAFDRPRPPEQRFRGAAPRYELPAELYGRLRAASRRCEVTLFATMMAAFDVLLSRWSGQTELNVGTGIANRRLGETQALMGMFVNNLVVRARLDDDPPFAVLARRVHDELVAAADRQELPFDVVVEALRPGRSLAWNPLFQVMFSFHDAPIPELRLPGVEVEVEPGISNGSAKFDLNVIAIPRAEQRVGQGRVGEGDGITLVWEYSSDLFDAATIDTMAAQYRTLLEAAAAAPETPVSRLPAAGPGERRRAVPALRLHPSPGALADGGVDHAADAPVSHAPEAASSPVPASSPAGETDARTGSISLAAPAGGNGAAAPPSSNPVATGRDDAAVREVVSLQLQVLREHAAAMRAQAEAMGAHAALMRAQLDLLRGTPVVLPALPHLAGRSAAADAVVPAGDTIHRLFEAQAARAPDRDALVWEGGALTCAALNERANRLAHHLAGLGVGMETRVAVCMERGPELIAALLAVLKAGGAYLPLDPGYPAARLAAMLADADARVLLTQEALRPRLHPIPSVRVVSVDGEAEAIAARSAANPITAAGAGTLAYVMYTSGSTGTPKGVAVEHRGVVRLVRGATYAELGPDEVILQAAPVSFDASTFEIWGALLNGGRLALAPPPPFGLVELGGALARHRVTTLWLTAGLFRAMVDERLEELGGVRQLLAGGDVLPEAQVRRVRERFPALRLVNGYGPTENTTFTCCHTVGAAWEGGPVPIGTPIGGTRVHVLDAALRPVPDGAEGELFAGGAGVARGYLNRPALTAERFVPDPFGPEPGARLYCTGDRVRRRGDGTLEYRGRLDAQVKIRGFRVEPGEVEAVLRGAPGVRDCAVAAREDRPGEKRLVAWVAGEAGTDELRAHLAGILPAHLLPAAIVRMDALPLNANGKVDRAALPDPEAPSHEAEEAAPRTPAEARVAEIWAALLGVERVGRGDSFFSLGGSSLLGMRMVSRVREAFGVELPLRALFDAPTVADLARRVETPDAADVRAEGAGGNGDGELRWPASFAQQRLWFIDRLSPGGSVYNVSRAVRLAGPLDAAALERALGEAVRRHAPLRTTLRREGDGVVQVVAPFAGFALPVDDLSALRSNAREAEALRRAGEHALRPFDLAAGPLFHAALLRLDGEEHVLLLCMHHAVSDGWSMEVLFRELEALYAAFRAGLPSPLSPLPLQYGEHAASERERLGGPALERELAWWRERLADAPPLLELPADHPRPPVQSFRGAREPVALSAEVVQGARALARAEGATLFQVLLAAFHLLLARYAGTTDVVLGTPVAGRTRRELEGLVGFFANTLALRTDLSGDPDFREVLRRTRGTVLDAWEHQDAPFEKVVEAVHPGRSLGHSPLFQVTFALEEGAASVPALEGVRAERMEIDRPTARWDLEVVLAPDGAGMKGYAAYATDLFEPGTVRRMMRHLERVVEQGVAAPGIRASRVELLSDAERRAVLEAFASPGVPEPAATCIHPRFDARGARAYVLDEWQRPVPPGVPGELCLGGDGLAREYPGRPALTAARFVPDPFAGVPGARMYRTGERVRWRNGADALLLEPCRRDPAEARGGWVQEATATYQPPRTATEAALAGIWARLLGTARVGVHDDFFALGGHSLLGARVMSRVLDELGVELHLRDLFEHPTVAGLAERVEAHRHTPAQESAEADAADGPHPLSFAQERLWFLERLQPGSAFYNVPWALRLRGALDTKALERALGEVVRRHGALRTVFPEVDGAPVQVVAPFAGLALAVEEVAGADGEAREAELQRRLDAEAQRPFDLAAGPLLRARLLRLGAAEHVLLVCMHHIVTDGWSLRVMRTELAELYGAFRDGHAPSLPALSLCYAEYAAEQRERLRGPVLERELAFWRERLAGAPALLELPTDHPRPALQSFRGATERIHLPPALLQRLREVGRGERVSAFMVLLAAFKLLLARYAGATDLVVGTLVAGRTRSELEGLVGFLVNTVVLRTGLSGDPGFREALRRVRASTLEAFEHQELPFEKVVEALQPERSLGHSPLFQAAFRLVQGGEEAPLAGVDTEALEIDLPVIRFDLSAIFTIGAGEFGLALEYATDLFERATIVRMAGHLRRVLEQVAEDPDLPLSRLALLDAAGRRRVLEEWNPPAPRPSDACVHHLFQAQAERTPTADALVFHGRRLTYAELDARANRLAHHLRARGVRPESCVGVCLERTPAMVAALLAVLKAGGACVPLDPAYPRERLGWMTRDAGVRLVLTSDALAPRLPDGVEAVRIDALADGPAPLPDAASDGGAGPDNLSHVIFTSGSTGRPKGVMIRHAATVARLRWLREAMDDGERAAVLGSTSINFDVSIAEIFGTLCWGGTLVLVENALELPRAAAEVPVRTACMVPSAAAELLRADGIPPCVRTLNLGGEALPPDLARALLALGTVTRVTNLYGPTEDTTYSTAWRVEPGAARVRIGRPLAGGRAYVLDGALEPVPPGVPGELYLGGIGVARGYAARPELTAERFLPDPFGPAGSRMYRTMDRARWTAEGELDYLGRTDFQVKVRGFRIELGEIEAALRGHPEVREAVAVARDEAGGGSRVVAYVTGGAPAEALRAHLRERLPGYMVPAVFVALERLPLTPNGKVDRGALPPPAPAEAPGHRLEPETETESRVAALWRELLDLPAVGVEESFFDLGGHSLLLARLQTRLARELGSRLTLVELFQCPTVRAIAARLQGGGAPAGAELGVERGTGRQAGLARLGGRRRQ